MQDDKRRMTNSIIIAVMILAVIACCPTAWSAEIVDSSRLADAIYKAEGGDISKPYGILKDYCKRGDPDGQCRKGCIQTIDKWKKKIIYSDAEGFIKQFAEIYAPSKAHPLNKNWPGNVIHFYRKGKQ